MKKVILILTIFINTNYVFSQCTIVTGLHTTNINYNNALANWIPLINIDHYKIQYKVLCINKMHVGLLGRSLKIY